MSRILIVAQHEFMSILRKRSFLFAMIGVPLFSIAMMALVIFVQVNVIEGGTTEINQMGYVDLSGVLSERIDEPENFIRYETEDAASAALEASEVDGYFVVPQLYIRTGQVSVYAQGTVSAEIEDSIEDYLTSNLVASVEAESQLPPERLEVPVDMLVYLESSGREVTRSGFAGMLMLPLVFSMVFLFALQFSGTFLMSSVVEEKTNRLMEILITSITPMQLLAGKLLGLGVIGLLQIVVWVVVGMGIVFVGQQQQIEALAAISFPVDVMVVGLVFFLLTYFLYASVLAGVGVVTGTEQDSRQIAGLFIMPIILPFFFIAQFLTDPDGPLPTFFSIFPFTSGMSMLIRMVFTSVPLEQMLLSFAILVLTTVFVVWASARVFRWGMLLYGKRPGIGAIFRALTRRVEMGSTSAVPKEASS